MKHEHAEFLQWRQKMYNTEYLGRDFSLRNLVNSWFRNAWTGCCLCEICFAWVVWRMTGVQADLRYKGVLKIWPALLAGVVWPGPVYGGWCFHHPSWVKRAFFIPFRSVTQPYLYWSDILFIWCCTQYCFAREKHTKQAPCISIFIVPLLSLPSHGNIPLSEWTQTFYCTPCASSQSILSVLSNAGFIEDSACRRLSLVVCVLWGFVLCFPCPAALCSIFICSLSLPGRSWALSCVYSRGAN